MPKITHHQEETIRRAVRDAYAIDPIISRKRVIEILERRFNKSFDPRYVERIIKKVNGEAAIRLDQMKVEKALAEIRETNRIIKEKLMVVALGQSVGDRPIPTYTEMTAASRAIGILMKLQLDAAIDLGIYDKGISTVDAEFRFKPIPEEIRAQMVITARMWRLPENLTRKIEPGGTITVEATKIPIKQVVTQPTPQNEPKNTQPVGGATQGNVNRPPVIADQEVRLS